ncbi:hypothetical protein HDV00_000097 [Rhizophlyctis rosea]|nr:hypothetical protein HDV00_000097 [Rhizophlyctis rosea]
MPTHLDEYQWQINLLYTVYSLPNIILPLIGGILIDKLGAPLMLGLFTTCVCLGQTVFASGIQSRKFPVMLAGRILFGLGGESLEVAQARVTTDWFKGRSLAFALGLNLSASRLATAANDIVSPWIAKHIGTPWAGWMGCLMCLVSFGSGIAVISLDRPASRLKAGIHVNGSKEEREPLLSDAKKPALRTDASATDIDPSADEASHSKHTSVIPSVVTQADEIGQLPPSAMSDEDGSECDDYVEEDETVHLGQIVGMSSAFWCLCLVTIMLYGAAVPFFHICTDFFQQKWYPGDAQMAGIVMSIPDIISAVGSPLGGLFVDRYGQRGTLLPIAGLLIFITHAMLCFTTISPIISMSVLGVSYSVFASAIWPCVPYLVGPHQIATAYGLVTVALNISLAVFPLMVAQVRNAHSEDFTYVEYFFMTLSLVATLCAVWLNVLDARNGWVLSRVHRMPGSPRLKPSVGGIGGEGGGGDEERRRVEGLGGNEDDEDDSDVTVKVVGEGILVPTPATRIHHHHPHSHSHHHRHGTDQSALSVGCNCALDNGGWEGRGARSWSGALGGSRSTSPLPPGAARGQIRARSKSPVKRLLQADGVGTVSGVGDIDVGRRGGGSAGKGKGRRDYGTTS